MLVGRVNPTDDTHEARLEAEWEHGLFKSIRAVASYREGSPEGTLEEARIWDHPKKGSSQISLVRNL